VTGLCTRIVDGHVVARIVLPTAHVLAIEDEDPTRVVTRPHDSIDPRETP